MPPWRDAPSRLVSPRVLGCHRRSRRPGGDRGLQLTVSLDGLRTTQLTSSPEDEIAPELSPDGRRLLFSRRLSGYQRFANREPDESPREFVPGALVGWFSMSLPDRREERMVLSEQDPGWGARFSPDGQRIALSLFGALHTVNADGTGLRRHSAEGSVSPAWAGLDSLVYVRFQPGSSGGPALAKLRLGEAAEPSEACRSTCRRWMSFRPSSSFSTGPREGARAPLAALQARLRPRPRGLFPGVF